MQRVARLLPSSGIPLREGERGKKARTREGEEKREVSGRGVPGGVGGRVAVGWCAFFSLFFFLFASRSPAQSVGAWVDMNHRRHADGGECEGRGQARGDGAKEASPSLLATVKRDKGGRRKKHDEAAIAPPQKRDETGGTEREARGLLSCSPRDGNMPSRRRAGGRLLMPTSFLPQPGLTADPLSRANGVGKSVTSLSFSRYVGMQQKDPRWVAW